MEVVTFKATDQQIAQMAALATNASLPVGMGIHHYKPDTTWEAKDFYKIIKEQKTWLNLDYIEGRCVKFTVWRGTKRNQWKYPAHEPRDRFQTWIAVYPTYPELMKAAGIEE